MMQDDQEDYGQVSATGATMEQVTVENNMNMPRANMVSYEEPI